MESRATRSRNHGISHLGQRRAFAARAEGDRLRSTIRTRIARSVGFVGPRRGPQQVDRALEERGRVQDLRLFARRTRRSHSGTATDSLHLLAAIGGHEGEQFAIDLGSVARHIDRGPKHRVETLDEQAAKHP